MRMKSIKKSRTLRDAANEFLSFKKAQKVRERTLKDYEKYIFPFVEQSSNSMEIGILKKEILATLHKTSRLVKSFAEIVVFHKIAQSFSFKMSS